MSKTKKQSKIKRFFKFYKRLPRKKQIIIGVLAFLIIAVIAGTIYFGLFHDKKDSILKPKETKKEVVEENKIKIVDVNSKSRPYAVMINNVGIARPYQSGLQDAYIVYEMIVEGGLTRLMAVFKDVEIDRIGTVRSSRHYYLDYALENDAIYVHWGWSPQAESDMKTLGVNNINGLTYGGKYFWKDKSLNVSTEHTAYTKTEMLKNATAKLKYREETNKELLLTYDADPVDYSTDETAKDAKNVEIVYSTSVKNKYEYDEENQVYKRSVNGKAHTDYVTKEQYTFKNIIVYQVQNSTIGGDAKGRQEFNNVGNGEGYYISNGKAIEIKWTKASRSEQTKYFVKSTGEKLVVNDGNTFIQIQPTGQAISLS